MIIKRKNEEDLEDLEDLGPSKSELKRRAERLQDLGKELTTLGEETLAKIALPEELLDQLAEYKRMRSFGAQRRQLQLIGKVMRALDPDKVRTAIDRARGVDKAAVAAHHRAENLRAALIKEDKYLTNFVEEFPNIDVQNIRRLVRAARKEAENNKPPKSSRELYRIIYALILPPLVLEAETEASDEEN
ncbi:MAG: DUF615 domain-containing protein [Burkholderiales bacterium]|nr:DUF615 domain-containing protein [Burkholderiales bacterium]